MKSRRQRRRRRRPRRSTTLTAMTLSLPDGHRRGHVEAEAREAAPVRADHRAVDVDVGDDVGAVELQEDALAGGAGGRRVVPPVPADAAVVVAAAVLAVHRVPGVRQVDRRPRRIVERGAGAPLSSMRRCFQPLLIDRVGARRRGRHVVACRARWCRRSRRRDRRCAADAAGARGADRAARRRLRAMPPARARWLPRRPPRRSCPRLPPRRRRHPTRWYPRRRRCPPSRSTPCRRSPTRRGDRRDRKRDRAPRRRRRRRPSVHDPPPARISISTCCW